MSKVPENLPFNFPSKKPLEVEFSALDLSSDAGLLLIKQAETNLQICQGITNCLEDKREQHKIRHSLSQLISQRIYQIVAGYEDAVDSNYLRHDPIFKIICGKTPIIGAELLASQPTISRLENQITTSEIKRIRRFYVDKFIESYQSKPTQIILDIDGWDALTYGEQQLSLFHGYYGHKIYFPCLINEAKSGYPLILQLRPGNSHSGKGIIGLLRWLFWRLKKAWANVEIILRGDGGFSLPEIINLCERQNVKYVFGFSSNQVLKRKIDYLLDQARLQYVRTKEKARLFGDVYYRAKSWAKPRRIVMKAEWLEKGGNPRFLVTNIEMSPQKLYDNFYVQRGATSEQRIKELKLGINADRLSCHQFMVNQFRLFLYQAAYILMLEIRYSAEETRLENAQVLRIRETLIKIGAKVTVSARRILVELANHCPFKEEIKVIAQKLLTGRQLIFS
jgi:hypothetical protein